LCDDNGKSIVLKTNQFVLDMIYPIRSYLFINKDNLLTTQNAYKGQKPVAVVLYPPTPDMKNLLHDVVPTLRFAWV
jgi:hypothetical protein